MQKKGLIPLVLLIVILAGCGGSKKSTRTGSQAPDANMQIAAAQTAKRNFFDESIGGFQEVDTFVLDDETSDALKAADSGATLAWQEPIQQPDSQKLVLYFEYDSNQLRSDQLDKIPAMKSQIDQWLNNGSDVVFKGHACRWGKNSRKRNLPLSDERAYVSADTIFGIAHNSHVKTFGVGNEEPVAFDSSKEGQAPNRRVEIYPLSITA